MKTDVLIIGGGIAGASLAFQLAPRCRVTLVERESEFGVHATGRSAAEWSMVHAAGMTRALTGASRTFLEALHPGFGDYPLLRQRGNVIVARPGSEAALDRLYDESAPHVAGLARLEPRDAGRHAPFLSAPVVAGAIYDPGNCTIDVDALLNGFLRAARRDGAAILKEVAVLGGVRQSGGWRVSTSAGEMTAAMVVNGAGAWADQVATLFEVPALGLTARRRTAITFELPALGDFRAAASVDDIATGAYLKPEGGGLMASPGDATDSPPCDAAPEEIDVATGAWIAEELTGRPVTRLIARWAGLRTFAKDEQPVVGWDGSSEGFFWLAGLGGAGLMTSPALGAAAAGILLDGEAPAELCSQGIDAVALSPQRPDLGDGGKNQPSNVGSTFVSSALRAS